jgi:hypothetical protein
MTRKKKITQKNKLHDIIAEMRKELKENKDEAALIKLKTRVKKK